MILLGVALILTSAASDEIVRNYMLCVRRAAIRLEPSEAPPSDVAQAAVLACQAEELKAINIDVSEAKHLRDTAIFYATGQAVGARLCRKTHDCGAIPVPKAPSK